MKYVLVLHPNRKSNLVDAERKNYTTPSALGELLEGEPHEITELFPNLKNQGMRVFVNKKARSCVPTILLHDSKENKQMSIGGDVIFVRTDEKNRIDQLSSMDMRTLSQQFRQYIHMSGSGTNPQSKEVVYIQA